ncbi:unnamed protein product [Dicrocoelium dendriticum]|nr:unnamed protein product [Dicrocoelium dendriticum]
MDDWKYYFQIVDIPVDEESSFSCESVQPAELGTIPTDETVEDITNEQSRIEGVEKAQDGFRRMQNTAQTDFLLPTADEYIRNYLLENNFIDTLNAFQVERFRQMHKGSTELTEAGQVPSVYVELSETKKSLSRSKQEICLLNDTVKKQEENYKRLHKEKEYYALMHRRSIEEKCDMLNQVKKMKKHYEEYEPLLKQLQKKYNAAMREKALNLLERDRALEYAEDLRTALASLQKLGIVDEESRAVVGTINRNGEPSDQTRGAKYVVETAHTKQNRDVLNPAGKSKGQSDTTKKTQSGAGIAELPPDTGVNPLLLKLADLTGQTDSGQTRKLILNVQTHETAASGLSIHPSKPLLCSAGDDKQCKLWSAASVTPLLTFAANGLWLSSAELNPKEDLVATAGGDGTVQIWRLELDSASLVDADEGSISIEERSADQQIQNKAEHAATLKHHVGAVWSLCWHWEGRFLASGGLDGIICIWDCEKAKSTINATSTGRHFCRSAFRKHHGSVNSVAFLPYGNIMVSASVDKTVSLWDVRSGICIRSLIGHEHSVNHATFNQQGTCIASCDSGGSIRIWDLRRFGRHPDAGKDITLSHMDWSQNRKSHFNPSIKQLAFDLSGKYVAAACADTNIGYLEVMAKQMSYLQGHDDAVQSVVFDYSTDRLYSLGDDGRICVWK